MALTCKQLTNVLPEGAERILAALKPETPKRFLSCIFFDESCAGGKWSLSVRH